MLILPFSSVSYLVAPERMLSSAVDLRVVDFLVVGGSSVSGFDFGASFPMGSGAG